MLKRLEQLLLVNREELSEQGQLLRGHLIAEMNVWRTSLSEGDPSETPDFRLVLQKYLADPDDVDRRVRCQVSGRRGPNGPGFAAVIGAHIWPERANAELLVNIGLEPTDLNDARNGLFLLNGIEKAFDRQQLTFTLLIIDSVKELRLRILDKRLAEISALKYVGGKDVTRWPQAGANDPTFMSLEGKKLNYNENTPPFRRLLALHAELSVSTAQVRGWNPLSPVDLANEMGNLPQFRRLSDDDVPLFKTSLTIPSHEDFPSEEKKDEDQ